MKVLVCGGQDFHDATFVNAELDRLHAERPFSVVIEGDARGVDRLAGDWARSRSIALVEYAAQWKT